MDDYLWLIEVREGDKLIVRTVPIVGDGKEEEATVERVTNNFIVANGIRYRRHERGWGAGKNYDRRIVRRAL